VQNSAKTRQTEENKMFRSSIVQTPVNPPQLWLLTRDQV